MKSIALLFSLPVMLSSCGTTHNEKQIQPIQERVVSRREVEEELDLGRYNSNTYVYLISDKSGKLVFLGENRGYNISNRINEEGVWLTMRNPRTNEPKPVYVYNNIIVSSFRLD